MSGIEGAAVGAAASIGVAAYNTLSGFSARHDHSHDAQAAETRRLIEDFDKLRKIGDMDDEDYALYMEQKDNALQSGKAYRDSISEFKNTTTLNPVKKFKKREQVRKSKRRVREANQSLQDLYYHSSSAGSDASSVTAESGSPPESQAIREWADTTTSSSAHATRFIRIGGHSPSFSSGSDASQDSAESGRPSPEFLDIQEALAEMKTRPRLATGIPVSSTHGRHITIKRYTLSFYHRDLIEDAEVSLKYGHRYGLIGENGSGKSTFLQSIAERDIETPPHNIRLVREEADRSELNAVDFVIASLGPTNTPTPEDKAGRILCGLGFSQAMMKKPTNDLSDGWRMRVALAEALFIRPHLLLLDEPTKYLDVRAIVWLEAYLSTYNHILVITSNSANFMDKVCTDIIDLTSKKLVYYDGNYSAYVKAKQENEASPMNPYYRQLELIRNIKSIATPGTKPGPGFLRQPEARQKTLDKVEATSLIAPVETRNQFWFKFEDTESLPPPVIIFDSVAFSYSGNKEDYLYQKLSFGIDMASRVAILGGKGAGKSTLLSLITGDLQPSEGVISKHPSVKFAHYSRHSAEQLPQEDDPIDCLSSVFGQIRLSAAVRNLRRTTVISYLNRFGIPQTHWHVLIEDLSSGLRNKLSFAQLAMKPHNILLLDEPTNHLDMESVDALTRAIQQFQGGVIIVSNDFSFISQVAEELWEVTNKGIRNLTEECITIMDYKETLVNQIIAQRLDSGESEDDIAYLDPFVYEYDSP